ncbi:MAG: 30S ribosomal protein S17 [Omnitrophica bacterium RIFCSPHIGHO2_02_FULL_63_14]|nr:MAG: 30S ribosomal protein S17 [Omnitrophica bacterium RIFCSPHIGHO2_02_FULL_63_14]
MRKERIGVVTSDKMQKTIVVQVRRHTLHPLYGKVIQKAVKFKVHDEKNEAKIGDRVRIVETRPLSKDKRWRLAEILSHGHLKASADLKEEVVG